MTKKQVIGYVLFGLAWLIQIALLMEINNMIFGVAGYDRMCQVIWIPELGLTAKDSFIIFISLLFVVPLNITIGTWYFTHRSSNCSVGFNLDPTVPRVVIIGILLFLEALLMPTYTILMNGRFPNQIEITMFLVGAILQVVTYLLSFLGLKKEEIK